MQFLCLTFCHRTLKLNRTTSCLSTEYIDSRKKGSSTKHTSPIFELSIWIFKVTKKLECFRCSILATVYIGKVCTWKHQQYRDTIFPSLLALATLGDVTQIEMIQSVFFYNWDKLKKFLCNQTILKICLTALKKFAKNLLKHGHKIWRDCW